MSEREISYPRIGERIRAVRLARGFRRQKDLYERIGMNSSHYSRIEKGDRPISISDLQQIAAATSCPIEYLINGHASRLDDDLKAKLGVDNTPPEDATLDRQALIAAMTQALRNDAAVDLTPAQIAEAILAIFKAR